MFGLNPNNLATPICTYATLHFFEQSFATGNDFRAQDMCRAMATANDGKLAIVAVDSYQVKLSFVPLIELAVLAGDKILDRKILPLTEPDEGIVHFHCPVTAKVTQSG